MRIIALQDLRLDLGKLTIAKDARSSDHRQQVDGNALALTSASRSSPRRPSPDLLTTARPSLPASM